MAAALGRGGGEGVPVRLYISEASGLSVPPVWQGEAAAHAPKLWSPAERLDMLPLFAAQLRSWQNKNYIENCPSPIHSSFSWSHNGCRKNPQNAPFMHIYMLLANSEEVIIQLCGNAVPQKFCTPWLTLHRRFKPTASSKAGFASRVIKASNPLSRHSALQK